VPNLCTLAFFFDVHYLSQMLLLPILAHVLTAW